MPPPPRGGVFGFGEKSFYISGMDIVNANIAEYLLNVTPDRDEVLEDMEQYALARKFPIVGPLVGRLLFMLAQSTRAARILELGSGFGYSAYWFGQALPGGGRVICTAGSE